MSDMPKIFLTSLYPTMVEKSSPDLGQEFLVERSRIFSCIATGSFSVDTISLSVVGIVIHIVEKLCCLIALLI